MFVRRVRIKNWRNFRSADVFLGDRMFIVGPNASGKSNFLDIFRFMKDIVKQPGGGLQKAVSDRGGLSKIRCLTARRDPHVELEFHFEDSGEKKSSIVIDKSPSAPTLPFDGSLEGKSDDGSIKALEDKRVTWKYIIGIKFEGKGRQRTLIAKEEVWKGQQKILERPDRHDKKDDWRLTQTHLEQINSNKEFRLIYDFFNSVKYFHIIPQLVRQPEMFFNTTISRGEDAFGFHFLETIMDTSKNTKDARLRKIQEALRIAVPQLENLTLMKDDKGIPHLEATYKHWRPKAGKQWEDQFSDGTLRLIGFLWSILETNSLLLLEEPELSLNSSIVRKIPAIIHRITKKKKQQLIISTHSPDLLSDPSIGGEETLIFQIREQGTEIIKASSIEQIKHLLESGLTVSEAILPFTRPEKYDELQGLFG